MSSRKRRADTRVRPYRFCVFHFVGPPLWYDYIYSNVFVGVTLCGHPLLWAATQGGPYKYLSRKESKLSTGLRWGTP